MVLPLLLLQKIKALQVVQYPFNLSHGVCLHPQQRVSKKHLRLFHHIYCTTANNVLSYSCISVAFCPIPFQIPTKQDQVKLKHQSDTNHMTHLISCDWSHPVWNASNTPPVSLGDTNTAQVYSFHFPRVFTLLLHKPKTRCASQTDAAVYSTTLMSINTTLENRIISKL